MSIAVQQVRVTYNRGSGPATTIPCDLLVVACDPGALLFEPGGLPAVMPPTPQEYEIFGAQKNFVFQTTLVSVPTPAGGSAYGVILDPAAVRKMRGDVCGFRNESAKQYSLAGANQLAENYLVVYQYWSPDSGTPKPTPQDLRRILGDQLGSPELPWWPYARTWSPRDDLYTDYFHQFDKNGLAAKLPWKLLGIQGANQTVYVSASTCFESVLQCWQYQDLLLPPNRPRPSWLPEAKDASIVIIGAGVSGLLFANRLRASGYTAVTLLERDPEHIGGKTHTVEMPTAGRNETTVCELGTCYMSPAYNDLVYQYLSPFTAGNTAKGFEVRPGVAGNFRGMVTTGTIYDQNHKPWPDLVVAYDEYIVLSYQMWNGQVLDPSKGDEVADAIGALLAEYAVVGAEAIGDQLPMPTQPPRDLDTLTDTYQNWLTDPNRVLPLKGLIGLLDYAYSVQGYGPLADIPAYYGLVWISPSLALLLDLEAYFGDPLVTYWTKGWGDVWKQMAATLSTTTRIERGVTITSIDRNLTAQA
jgi:hypothetical protein